MRATLAAAYGEGLLSQGTLAHRLDQLGVNRVIEPDRLIGDLNLRESQRGFRLPTWLRERVTELWPLSRRARVAAPVVLALDWAGTTETLLLGRHSGCDVVVDGPTVSRRHAQLIFRDGSWVLHDLGSTNGTIVNGARVTRCQLRPGDQLTLGEHYLVVD
jgi:FHA domain-containing protein